MCGIVGFINHENSSLKTIDSLKKISSRGLNSSGIYDKKEIQIKENPTQLKESNSTFSIGHNLHAIEGFQPQPIQLNNSILAFNGEIYNYTELNKELDITTNNDSQTLLNLFDKENNFLDSITKLDGDFAICFVRDDTLYLARDIIGVKPMWYFIDENNNLEFSSEKKVLNKNSIELFPNQILEYNIKTKNSKIISRELKYPQNELRESHDLIKTKTWNLLTQSIKKRLPSDKNKKIGLLFSGGIDSTVIALILKQLGVNFTCYTAEIKGGNLEEAEDLIFAKEISKLHNLKLKVATTSIDNLEQETVEVMKLIESNDYIKTSVALPFFLACKEASKDRVEVMFSGLGSEEVFAGYRRHKQAKDPNLECYEGLKIMHQRDLYRDDVITMKFTQELRVPFLDKDLINYALQIPAKYKLDLKKIDEIKDEVLAKPYLNSEVRSKIILREATREYTNLEERYLERQKKAAQYGSKFDKGLLRLSKNAKLQKQDYLDKIWIENISKDLPQREIYK